MGTSWVFDIGDRVVYINFKTLVYGTITDISIELPEEGPNDEEVRIYTIAMDEAGTFTGLSKHLRRVQDER